MFDSICPRRSTCGAAVCIAACFGGCTNESASQGAGGGGAAPSNMGGASGALPVPGGAALGSNAGGVAGALARSDAGAIEPGPSGGSAGGGAPPMDAGDDCVVCAEYGAPQLLGTITESELDELSGIAASVRNPGVVYVHNDRDRPQVFALSGAGALLAMLEPAGASVRDVEDMAVGPCDEGSCIYLADIGGNLGARPDFAILRSPEPDLADIPAPTVALSVEELRFTYPDGQHNAESLLVDPASATLYVITKQAAGQSSDVYRVPAEFGGPTVMAVKVADLSVPAADDQPATSANAHPCGAGFLLRTNDTLYEFRIERTAAFETAFTQVPAVVPAGEEQQSEGVSYRPDGAGYFTTSEGQNPPIHWVGCQ